MLLTSSVSLPKALWNFGFICCLNLWEKQTQFGADADIDSENYEEKLGFPHSCLCLLAAGDAVFLSYTNSFFPSETQIHQVNTQGSLQTPHGDDQETRVQI